MVHSDTHDSCCTHNASTACAPSACNPRVANLLLLGFGQIGRRLASIACAQQEAIRNNQHLDVQIAGIADRSGYLLAANGFDESALNSIAAHKAAGNAIASFPGAVATTSPIDFVQAAAEANLQNPILADISDADGMHSVFVSAMQHGMDVVTANKKPLADDAAGYRAIVDTAQAQQRIVKGESTVGAGLPVLDAIETLVRTGDTVRAIEGCMSGTLGYLLTAVEDGAAFSDAVAEAVRLGYTEPDPMADLSGADVGRKAVILGRWSTIADERTPLHLAPLVSASLGADTVDELLTNLRDNFDATIANKLRSAQDAGETLRYVGSVKPGSLKVSLQRVPRDSPLGALRGADNMLVIHSDRYDESPLVVRGPGAGADVTAMGVLSDALRIAERSTTKHRAAH